MKKLLLLVILPCLAEAQEVINSNNTNTSTQTNTISHQDVYTNHNYQQDSSVNTNISTPTNTNNSMGNFRDNPITTHNQSHNQTNSNNQLNYSQQEITNNNMRSISGVSESYNGTQTGNITAGNNHLNNTVNPVTNSNSSSGGNVLRGGNNHLNTAINPVTNSNSGGNTLQGGNTSSDATSYSGGNTVTGTSTSNALGGNSNSNAYGGDSSASSYSGGNVTTSQGGESYSSSSAQSGDSSAVSGDSTSSSGDSTSSSGGSSVTVNQRIPRQAPMAWAPGLAAGFSQFNCGNSASIGVSSPFGAIAGGMPIVGDDCVRLHDVVMLMSLQQNRIACERMMQHEGNAAAMKAAGTNCEELTTPVVVPVANHEERHPSADYWRNQERLLDARINAIHYGNSTK
jgi:hypothetical protein